MENFKLDNLLLDYRELAFIMGIPEKTAKTYFLPFLEKDIVTLDDTVEAKNFVGKFGIINSFDIRYDKCDKFTFTAWQVSLSFRNHLNNKPCVKQQGFTGGKSYFYKVLSSKDMELVQTSSIAKYTSLYGFKNKPKKSVQS